MTKWKCPEGKLAFFRFLSHDGEENAIGDYSGTPTMFKISPGKGDVLFIHDLRIYLLNGGALKQDFYGKDIELDVGLRIIKLSEGSEVADFLSGMTIKKNIDWVRHGFTIPLTPWGLTASFMSAVGNLPGYGREPVQLHGECEDEIAIVLEDDFRALDEHYFQVAGFNLSKDYAGNVKP